MKRGASTSAVCQIVAHFCWLRPDGNTKKLYSVHTLYESTMPNHGHEHGMTIIAHFDLPKKKSALSYERQREQASEGERDSVEKGGLQQSRA